jgi:phosphatidate phosphatase
LRMDLEKCAVDANANETALKRLPITQYLADCVLLYGVVLGFEFLCRYIGPYQRGFFCDDESIRLPYKHGTVSATALFAWSFGAMVIVVLVTEYLRLNRRATTSEVYSEYEVGRTQSARLAIRFFIFYGYYQLALMITWGLTTMSKYPVGRLRPHFIAVCKPSIGYATCQTSNYITDYECTSGEVDKIAESRLSFYSGHSSLSMVAATYIALYVHHRLHGFFTSRTAVPLVQLVVVAFGLWISFTRIFDHMHHWSDVIIGISVGTTVALLVGINLGHLWNCESTSDEQKRLFSSQPPTRLISFESGTPTRIAFAPQTLTLPPSQTQMNQVDLITNA